MKLIFSKILFQLITNSIKFLFCFSQDERDRRNAYRKNHYLNRGKSHHQLKKDKKGPQGQGPPGAAAL